MKIIKKIAFEYILICLFVLLSFFVHFSNNIFTLDILVCILTIGIAFYYNYSIFISKKHNNLPFIFNIIGINAKILALICIVLILLNNNKESFENTANMLSAISSVSLLTLALIAYIKYNSSQAKSYYIYFTLISFYYLNFFYLN